MQTLQNKQIVLGITGGIAAYKSAELVRMLRKQGAQVHVVMTRAACEFITPLTMQALSGNPAHTDLLDPAAEAGMGHIELARWADLILVAPASADFIARMAQGMGNDLLSTLCLATKAPICLAPAMNQNMWEDPITQANLEQLHNRGVKSFGPASGFQACGDVGMGRMLEPEELAELCAGEFAKGQLTGQHVMITAGPTQESIDPVRYISNHSSGKMGFALAAAAQEAGAKVTLVAGPVHLPTPERVQRVDVTSAQQMYDAVHNHLDGVDIFIGCAAVADFRPDRVAERKIKKDHTVSDDEIYLTLIRNPDILASVAKTKPGRFVVGFAAETHDVLGYAREKMQRKNLDLIIANDVANSAIGFNSDENAVTVISQDDATTLPQSSKAQLARQLVSLIAEQLPTKIEC